MVNIIGLGIGGPVVESSPLGFTWSGQYNKQLLAKHWVDEHFVYCGRRMHHLLGILSISLAATAETRGSRIQQTDLFNIHDIWFNNEAHFSPCSE